MNKRATHKAGFQSNGADRFVEWMEQYFKDHPRSPSAVRRPKVSKEGDTFIVLLGRDMQHGIVGLGNTVENALRAFDLQYYNALRPPEARSATAKTRVRRENRIPHPVYWDQPALRLS